jgi:hypothetical protein
MNISIPALSAAAVLALGASFAAPRDLGDPGDVGALLESYDNAEAEWKQRVRDADSKARRDLRKNHPAATFWERFDAAANAGEGRALFWMATHLRDKGLKSSEVKEEKPVLYGRLFEQHVAADWFDDVLKQLPREKRYFEQSQIVGFYEQVIAKNEGAAIRAHAMFRLGSLLMDSDDSAEQEAGKGWLQKAIEAGPDTDYGMKARAELYRPVVGEAAPDFKGKTLDGYEFNLSDYRGKVVLLDFYGFW